MPTRRTFLHASALLTLGFCLPDGLAAAPAADELPAPLKNHPRVNAWIEILDSGEVRVLTGKTEIGQGIRTAVAQVAAEELDLPLSRISVVIADTGRTPNERYTAGSASIETSAMAVRYAAASARERLLERAAQRLKQPISALRWTADGIQATSGSGTRTLSLREAVGTEPLRDEVRLPVRLKAKAEHRVVGQSVPRTDIERMVRAEPVYIQDIRLPGMLHARVVRPPAYAARLRRLDTERLRREVPTLRHVWVDGSFIAVLATDEWQAQRGAIRAAELAEWVPAPDLPTEVPLRDALRQWPGPQRRVAEQGTALPDDEYPYRATYVKSYLMHGSVGPSCALAEYRGGTLRVWTHSQGVYPLRGSLSNWLNLPAERIRVTAVQGSGCYGHNGADDAAAEAALLAQAFPNTPIRLQWTRGDEHGWEPYGSAMRQDAAARLDESGAITHWRFTLWSDTHSTRPGGEAAQLLPARYAANPETLPSGGFNAGTYRNAKPYYAFPNQHIDAHVVRGPLRVSALRSLGAYGNVFALESFLDELAVASQQDPITLRLRHLTDPRARAVLERLRGLLPATPEVPEGLGVAFARYKNTGAYVAVGALVRADRAAGTLAVRKLWAVVDAGEVINPDGVRNQIEGGLIQAASWTLREAVRYDARHVTSLDWEGYPIFRFSDIPDVAVTLLDQADQPPLGVGEAAQGPTAAALANAVFRAAGQRLRELPLHLARG
jgi:nicotinate dehydrogenase subunit B